MTTICCSMGFLRNPKAFLMVLKAAIESTDYRFILFSSGYQPLDSAIQAIASSLTESRGETPCGDSTLLYNGRLFCFSGWVLDWCHMFLLQFENGNKWCYLSDQYHIAGSFLDAQLLFTMLEGTQLHMAKKSLTVANGLILDLSCYCFFHKIFIFLLLW